MKRMFLAGPFKALVDPKTNSMAHDDIELFTRIIDYFESRGWDVHCAHKREQWGREFMTPEACTKIDFEEISRCDYFVAFPGAPASPGTHIEIGWASALRKPIVLLLNVAKDYAFLIRGLDEVTPIQRVEYTGKRVDPSRIEEAVTKFSI